MIRLAAPMFAVLGSCACHLVIPHNAQPAHDAVPADAPRQDGPRRDTPRADSARLDGSPRPDAPRPDAPKPKPDAPKPKPDAPKPKSDAPKPKSDAPKPDAPKPCSKDTECGTYFSCCSGRCVNRANDPTNCGSCGFTCPSGQSFCSNSICSTPPCNTMCIGTTTCCDTDCCQLTQLCCLVPVPVTKGPTCETPVEGTCPRGNPGAVCLAFGTSIATPRGEAPVPLLVEGDLVYSIHQRAIRAVPILRTQRVAVTSHTVLRLELESGARFELSGAHPTAEGQPFDSLRVGDRLAGVRIRSIARVPYRESHTYDLLPASDSGLYFIGGLPVRSTMAAP